eukprot:CAMPEP_0181218322 /NCGR_PEP_ID=MMETSP1096-20121128/27635_1 /TAXON_ID=156174 ORGANISM="Chrysochromulina ericina, Strain CCMP281" /NCGR_SAMPLE_ID=MMETSP1096 /ASSEMBLY_ACC=CAM_ASM_000453 /LENGTH=127 /DNA_ID=CAMNT_0023310537 /DNA_START=13 /DNA_END=396 /DNA_ORIENTATION=+
MRSFLVATSLAVSGAFQLGAAVVRSPSVVRAGVPVAELVADEEKILTGTCKWFNSEKGFGFIDVDGEESDLFVHQTEINAEGFRSLAEGEALEFKCSMDGRTGKLRAQSVTGPGGGFVQGAPRNDYY